MSSEEEEARSRFSHKVYKNDPLLFRSYVNKKVAVKTDAGDVHEGVVYTVDPVSESVVLIHSQDEGRFTMKVIIGHAIRNIEVSSEAEIVIPELFRPTGEKLSESVVAKRKSAVKELLTKNRFPITEAGDILDIEGMVSIEPPYGPENCVSTNEIVLVRIQHLLSSDGDKVC